MRYFSFQMAVDLPDEVSTAGSLTFKDALPAGVSSGLKDQSLAILRRQ
jgi:hypothetical protein